ncbi:hypothetical protein THAOC_32223 [Thalassiosira oceanica]|uniref:Uncharacterized protein n=1 Tax=Thalassiosira oceanica TaxID=159749 RepID=K0R7L4_THAOC|nr:hypothetical protein THAOC_32223 [Thalassiosira oceanica]|eukprot:EJK48940.1 hypothetical protein THAOC_32223 [Thalassiosira oceanica]
MSFEQNVGSPPSRRVDKQWTGNTLREKGMRTGGPSNDDLLPNFNGKGTRWTLGLFAVDPRASLGPLSSPEGGTRPSKPEASPTPLGSHGESPGTGGAFSRSL